MLLMYKLRYNMSCNYLLGWAVGFLQFATFFFEFGFHQKFGENLLTHLFQKHQKRKQDLA